MQRKILISILALALVSGLIAIADASESYELTTNYPTGTVPLGSKATIEATTTDLNVNFIGFTWTDPSGKTKSYKECWTSSGPPFESTQTLDALGTWYLTVNFVDYSYGPNSVYRVLEAQEKTFEVRSTTLNTVPEVPLIGTIGITIAMVLGFTAFTIKKKLPSPKRSP